MKNSLGVFWMINFYVSVWAEGYPESWGKIVSGLKSMFPKAINI